MMSANTEYLIGSFLLLAALASPIVFCAAGWVGQRLPAQNSPRYGFRVAIYRAGACGAVMDMFCLYIAARFDPTHRVFFANLDRISSSVMLNGVPAVFLIAIGFYTVLLCLALGAIALKAAAGRIGKVLLHGTPHRHRCPLHHRCSVARHTR